MSIKVRSGFLLLLCAVVCLSVSGCIPFGDAFYSVEGTVYEWVNPPTGSESTIFYREYDPSTKKYVGENVPANYVLSPIANASLSFVVSFSEKSFHKFEPVTTDLNGKFHFFQSGPPTRKDVYLTAEVTLNGYQTVSRTFLNKTSHELTIVMVRAPEQESRLI